MNKTQLFAKSEKELCSYLPAYKTILSATAWVNPKTGEAKRFSAEQKLVWHYVLDRYKFFKDSNKDYFDNQADIAIACDVSERTVIRLFKDLSIAGYLEIHQIRVGGHKSNSYKITKDLVLVQHENVAKKASNSPVVERSEQTHINAQPEAYVEFEAAGKVWVNESLPLEDYEGIEFSVENESSSYVEWETSPAEIVQQKPVNACPFATAPTKRFKPNGSVSEEMEFWCNKNQVIITNVDGQTVFKHKAKRFVIEAGAFVEYKATTYKSSAPKTLAEAAGMEWMLNKLNESEGSIPF